MDAKFPQTQAAAMYVQSIYEQDEYFKQPQTVQMNATDEEIVISEIVHHEHRSMHTDDDREVDDDIMDA